MDNYYFRRSRHSSLGGSPNGSPKTSPKSFYTSGNAGALLATARQANMALQNHLGDERGRPSSGRVNNYHYYTQPVDPTALAAATRQVRTSRREQVSYIKHMTGRMAWFSQ